MGLVAIRSIPEMDHLKMKTAGNLYVVVFYGLYFAVRMYLFMKKQDRGDEYDPRSNRAASRMQRPPRFRQSAMDKYQPHEESPDDHDDPGIYSGCG